MRRILCACAVAAAAGVTAVSAQDSTVETRLKIDTDDAKAVSMTGCLQRDLAGNFTLVGVIAKAGDELTTTTKVETDVDDDRARVRTETETKVDEGVVGTTGSMGTFMLTPRETVALANYVGQQVQISAITLDADAEDAEVEIEEKTTVDPEDGDDSTKRTKTEIEIDRDDDDAVHPRYTVVSVKGLGTACR